jgi:hypothetical protein
MQSVYEIEPDQTGRAAPLGSNTEFGLPFLIGKTGLFFFDCWPSFKKTILSYFLEIHIVLVVKDDSRQKKQLKTCFYVLLFTWDKMLHAKKRKLCTLSIPCEIHTTFLLEKIKHTRVSDRLFFI